MYYLFNLSSVVMSWDFFGINFFTAHVGSCCQSINGILSDDLAGWARQVWNINISASKTCLSSGPVEVANMCWVSPCGLNVVDPTRHINLDIKCKLFREKYKLYDCFRVGNVHE